MVNLSRPQPAANSFGRKRKEKEKGRKQEKERKQEKKAKLKSTVRVLWELGRWSGGVQLRAWRHDPRPN